MPADSFYKPARTPTAAIATGAFALLAPGAAHARLAAIDARTPRHGG
jgi:hypothetical protein